MLAFAAFADAPVDVIVLEVGMGGEWDSTNVADGQVAVFTPIALDHTARLGNTVQEIARTEGRHHQAGGIGRHGHAGDRGARRAHRGRRPVRGVGLDRAARLRRRVDDGGGRRPAARPARARREVSRACTSRSTATTRRRTRRSRSRRSSRSWATAPSRSIRMSWSRGSGASRRPVGCSSSASSRRSSWTPRTTRTAPRRCATRSPSTSTSTSGRS